MATHPDPPVTNVLQIGVRPGHEQAFEAAMSRLIQVGVTQPGHLGATVLRPSAPHEPYRIVYKFDRCSNLMRWHESETRRALFKEIDPHIEAQTLEAYEGLETWFTAPTAEGPPKWKTTFVSWCAIFPTALLWTLALNLFASAWPWPARTFLLTALVVPTAGYFTAPWVYRWFRPWLRVSPSLPKNGSSPEFRSS